MLGAGIAHHRVVGRDEDRGPAVGQVPEGGDDHCRVVVVQCPGRLVSKDESGLADDEASQSQTLLLAAAEVVGRLTQPTYQADLREGSLQ